jgi:hypothetical protein
METEGRSDKEVKGTANENGGEGGIRTLETVTRLRP